MWIHDIQKASKFIDYMKIKVGYTNDLCNIHSCHYYMHFKGAQRGEAYCNLFQKFLKNRIRCRICKEIFE